MTITVKRVKWGKHYRIGIYENGKLRSTMKYSPKQGLTVKNMRKMLKENPEFILKKAPPKARKLLVRKVAEYREKELKELQKKYKSVYVDYIFRDWFTTTDRKKTKITHVSYEVAFTTFEKAQWHDSNAFTLTEEFTEVLRSATISFIENVLGAGFARNVDGSVSIEDEDYRFEPAYAKITLEEVEAEFKIEKGGKVYDYSHDYLNYIEDYLIKAIRSVRSL